LELSGLFHLGDVEVGGLPRSTAAIDPAPQAPRDRSASHAAAPAAGSPRRSGRSCAMTSRPRRSRSCAAAVSTGCPRGTRLPATSRSAAPPRDRRCRRSRRAPGPAGSSWAIPPIMGGGAPGQKGAPSAFAGVGGYLPLPPAASGASGRVLRPSTGAATRNRARWIVCLSCSARTCAASSRMEPMARFATPSSRSRSLRLIGSPRIIVARCFSENIVHQRPFLSQRSSLELPVDAMGGADQWAVGRTCTCLARTRVLRPKRLPRLKAQ